MSESFSHGYNIASQNYMEYLDIFYMKDVFTCSNLEDWTELYRSHITAIVLNSSPFCDIPEHVFICPQLEDL